MWMNAVIEVVFSLSIGLGTMTSFGSYNNNKKPLVLDSLLIAFFSFIIPVIFGVILFALIGHEAHEEG